MTPEITLTAGGHTLNAEATIERILGRDRALEYRCTLAGRRVDRPALARLVLAADVVAIELKAGGAAVTAVPLRVAGFEDTADGLVVIARPSAAAGLPPRAADRPKTALDVLAAVSDVLAVPTAVKNELSAIPLPLAEKTCFVQDGGTPAARVAAALACVATLAPSSKTRLGVVANAGGSPPLRAVWLDRAAYADSGTLDKHTLTFADGDGRDDFTFAAREDRPVVVWHRRDRPFSPAAWTAAGDGHMPAFAHGGLALEVRDRLFDAGNGRVGWDTAVYLERPVAAAAPAPVGWAGVGVVEAWQAPWLTVKLSGFPAGRDVAVAKLLTPSTGPNGTEGVYTPPYPTATVAVSWTGRIGEPMLCDGDRRDKVPNLPAPSVAFDQPLKVAAPVLSLAAKDRLEVAGQEVEVKAGGTARVLAETVVEVEGGGGKSQWKGGKFYAGKG